MLAYSMTCVTYITKLSSILTVIVYGQHYKDTFKLRSDVLTGYDKTICPLLNQTDFIHVYISYDIGPIQEINEVEETMTIYMQCTYTWTDEKVRWDTFKILSSAELSIKTVLYSLDLVVQTKRFTVFVPIALFVFPIIVS